METKNLALRVADVIKSKKGAQVVVLDMRPAASFCDYFVITTAGSLRQVNAISTAIQEDLESHGIKPLSRVSPVDESGWIVLDFSGVVAHIFYKPMREFYSLERLWSDAKRIRIHSRHGTNTRPLNRGNKSIPKKARIKKRRAAGSHT
ncbi:MAG: ribosome silencing factor [Candidatus Omnitrophica bacterium]|nr:ribosome silencing factor [Candidatus Omnitrophota bacterium]